MSPRVVVARRSFLAAVGLAVGSLAIGFDAPAAEVDAKAKPKESPRPTFGQLPADGFTPSAFVHVAADGTVTIVSSRSEMGQGVKSSVPALIADEMGADLARVRIVQADGDAAYGDQDTDGSSSVRGTMLDTFRKLGATARAMLIAAAAKKWAVPAAQCEARDHQVVHAASKRSIGFGDLAALAAKIPVPEDAPLRPTRELRYVGKAMPHVDAPDVVTGRAIYAADVRLPGVLVAVIARPPVVGGKVVRFDGARAMKVPGVKRVVAIPPHAPPAGFKALGGIAVVADNTWAAIRGRAALDVTWDHGANATYDSARYKEELTASVRAPGERVRNVGDVDAALARSARRIEAEYHVPHLAHAPMEPPCSIANVTKDGCEVWTCTQEPQSARDEVADELGIDKSKVRVRVTLLGGAFGRKAKPDYDREAAFLSRAVSAPVRVQWTREDDLRHGYFHSTCAQRLEAGLDDRGDVIAWRHRTAFPAIASTFKVGVTHPSEGELGQGILDSPLAIPNVRAESCAASARVRIGWLRSVHNINHAFAIGSFVDELAHARGADPLATWRAILGPARRVTTEELGVKKVPNYGGALDRYPIDVARYHGVLDRVTSLARWSDRAKDGRALGLAVHHSFLTYVAVVASAVKDARGKIRIDEAWVVADVGFVVNPDRVRAQMEGAFVFSMSHALHGAITMKDGAVEQSGFRDYRLARIGEAPRAIHVELVASEAPPGGAGEPGVPPVAPAIANAVFAATGTRVRELPIAKSGLV